MPARWSGFPNSARRTPVRSSWSTSTRWAIYRLKGAIEAGAINPANRENVVNKGVTAIGDALVSEDGPGRNADGSWTLGGWLYDLMNPGKAQAIKDLSKPETQAPAPVLPVDPYDFIFSRRGIVQAPDVYPDF